MDNKTTIWLVAFCLALIGWLYWDVSPVPIDYKWNSFLVNSSTGEKRRPIDVIDLEKVIKPTNEYVNQTSSIERLYNLAQQTNYANLLSNYPIYLDQRQLEQSGWPVANQTACAHQLGWIQSKLAASGHYSQLNGRTGQELTRLMDTFGKPEAGLYSGSLAWPGQYDACKQVSLDEGQIRTRYCLAMMRLKSWPSNESGIPKTRIKIGICIPETCDTLSFESQRDKINSLIKLDLNEFLRDNLVLDSMFCLPDERSPIRQLPTGGRVFFYTLAAWLTIITCASILYPIVTRTRQREVNITELSTNIEQKLVANKKLFSGNINLKPAQVVVSQQSQETQTTEGSNGTLRSLLNQIVDALSIQQSWASFRANPFAKIKAQAEMDGHEIRVDLAQVDSFKFLMAVLIVICHSYLIVSLYATSIDRRMSLSVSDLFYVFLNMHKLVDTFFLIFGLLAAYTMLRKFTVKQIASPLMWICVNIGILSRIMPIYFLIYWYSKSVEPYTGEGPWWDYGVNKYTLRGQCMEAPWWRAIPYLSQRRSKPNIGCVQTGWFIVSLVQISLVMPPLIYLLYKLPRHLYRYLLLIFITMVSCLGILIKMIRLSSIRETAYGTYGLFLLHMLDLFEDNGVLATLAKINCVACGCYTGYLLYQYEIGSIRRWPCWLTNNLTLALVMGSHLLVMFTPLAGYIYSHHVGHTLNLYDLLIGHIAAMIVWPILNALFAIQILSIYNSTPVCRALGHKFWHTANKLGFSIYLVHWNVLTYLTTSYQAGPYESYLTDVFRLAALGLTITLFLAFLVTILIDIPLSTLLALPLSQIRIKTTRVGGQVYTGVSKSKQQHQTSKDIESPQLDNSRASMIVETSE